MCLTSPFNGRIELPFSPCVRRLWWPYAGWNESFTDRSEMDYTPERVAESSGLLERLRDFIRSMTGGSAVRSQWTAPEASALDAAPDEWRKWSSADRALHGALLRAEEKVSEALADNFDTVSAVREAHLLINAVNSQLHSTAARGSTAPHRGIAAQCALFVSDLFRTFGISLQPSRLHERVSADSPLEELSAAERHRKTAATAPAALLVQERLLQELVDLRAGVRRTAAAVSSSDAATSTTVAMRELRASCDRLRDDVLPGLGYRLEVRLVGL